MVEMRTPIPVGEAVSKVMEYEKFGNGELVSINESYGRTAHQKKLFNILSNIITVHLMKSFIH